MTEMRERMKKERVVKPYGFAARFSCVNMVVKCEKRDGKLFAFYLQFWYFMLNCIYIFSILNKRKV